MENNSTWDRMTLSGIVSDKYEEQVGIEKAQTNAEPTCPECGGDLLLQGHCISCMECGFSLCEI